MENAAPASEFRSSGRNSDRALRIFFVLLVIAVLALGWQSYLIDSDWDPSSYVCAVRDGQWYVDLGYGRVGYLFLLRPLRWAVSLFPGGATYDSIYHALKALHLGFSLLLIGFWYGLASNLFGRRTALLGSPLLLLNVPFLTFTTRIWTEIPMLMGVYGALWIWAVFVWKEKDRRRRWTAYGIIATILAVELTVREIALFFLPAFVLPLLVTRGRRREGFLASAGLLAAAGVIFLMYALLRLLSPGYSHSVQNIETLFPVVLSPSAIAKRTAELTGVLLHRYFLVSALCLISLISLAVRKKWAMAWLLFSVSFLPVLWIVTRGGILYERYVVPAAPGFALGCLPLLARLEARGLRMRQYAVAGVLLAGLLFTADWHEIQGLKNRARMTKVYTHRWVERATRERGNTAWLVGSFNAVLYGRLTDGKLKDTNSLLWPSWSGPYKGLAPTIERDLKGGCTVYACLRRDVYSGEQWKTIQALKREFLFHSVDAKTRLFRLQARPLPPTVVVMDFSSETSWDFLREGFDGPEHWGKNVTAVWADRKRAVLVFSPARLPRLEKGDKAIRVRLRWFCVDRPGHPPVEGVLHVEYGNHTKSLPFRFHPGENQLAFDVPRSPDAKAPLRLELRFSSLWVPAETMPGSTDKRTLAAALVGVDLIPSQEQSP